MSTSGTCRSARNSVMPSVRFVTSASGVVRASSRHFSAMSAFVVQILRPRTTVAAVDLDGPRRDVRGVGAGVGLGDAERHVEVAGRDPRQVRRPSSHRCRASRPGSSRRSERWMAEQPFMHAPDAAISSSRIDASVMPARRRRTPRGWRCRPNRAVGEGLVERPRELVGRVLLPPVLVGEVGADPMHPLTDVQM